MRYRHLLSPVRLGRLELRNRIVMPGMGTFLGDPARPGVLTGEHLAHYEARARGGAALVFVEVTPVCFPEGAATLRQPGLATDAQEAAFAELARRVHAHGAALGVQLVHHGKLALADARRGEPVLVPSLDAAPRLAGDLAAGLTRDEIGRMMAVTGGRVPQARAATDADLLAIIAAFGEAAARARRAGLDCVEVHAAHGYLLSSFLSPAWNRRHDRWGGSPEGRARLAIAAVRAVKDAAGDDFPVVVRLDGAEHGVPGGITPEQAADTAARLAAAGADAVHVSAYGDPTSAVAFTDGPLPWRVGQYLPLARAVRRRVDVPVIAVGRLTPAVGEAAIASGAADLVAMGRALLADPDLPRTLAAVGTGSPGPRPCIACFACVATAFFDEPVTCATNPRVGRAAATAAWDATAPTARRVVIVGAGPAGLECARVAAIRGHRVVVLEVEPVPGGAANVAGLVNPPITELRRWLVAAASGAGAAIRTGTTATPEVIAALRPDVVVVATGARRGPPALPGVRAAVAAGRVLGADDLGRCGLPPGPRVVVVGTGGAALGVAERLARRCRVTLVCPGGDPGADLPHPRRARLLHEARRGGLVVWPEAAPVAVVAEGLEVRDRNGRAQVLVADQIVFTDPAPDGGGPGPVEGLRWLGVPVHVIGDAAGGATGPGGLAAALRSAFDLAVTL